MKGQVISKTIDESLLFSDLESQEDAIWNLLLFSGYLKVTGKEVKGLFIYYDLAIPNLEILYLFQKFVAHWLKEQVKNRELQALLDSLTQGEVALFEQKLRYFAEAIFSYYDTQDRTPESFYHAFLLGLLVHLSHIYEIKSNRESGYGRYDLALLPKNKEQLAIIIEIKSPDRGSKKGVKTLAKEALEQIQAQKYHIELRDRGFKNLLKLGLGIRGKQLKLESKTEHFDFVVFV